MVLRGGAGMLHGDCTTTVKAVADGVCVLKKSGSQNWWWVRMAQK